MLTDYMHIFLAAHPPFLLLTLNYAEYCTPKTSQS